MHLQRRAEVSNYKENNIPNCWSKDHFVSSVSSGSLLILDSDLQLIPTDRLRFRTVPIETPCRLPTTKFSAPIVALFTAKGTLIRAASESRRDLSPNGPGR
jgi:hypothetical protein